MSELTAALCGSSSAVFVVHVQAANRDASSGCLWRNIYLDHNVPFPSDILTLFTKLLPLNSSHKYFNLQVQVIETEILLSKLPVDAI